jgi:hypothetical protein
VARLGALHDGWNAQRGRQAQDIAAIGPRACSERVIEVRDDYGNPKAMQAVQQTDAVGAAGYADDQAFARRLQPEPVKDCLHRAQYVHNRGLYAPTSRSAPLPNANPAMGPAML